MAFTDDFAIIGGAGDDFDCEATTNWVTTGTPQAISLGTDTKSVQGTNAITIKAGSATAGIRACYHDVAAVDRFKVAGTGAVTVNFWLNYSKGKGAQILTSTGTAVVVRLYFGGTTDWADYRMTDEGNDSLNFGYQVLQCSGRNLNGGTTSGTWSNTAANWERDIWRVELRLDMLTPNDGTDDPPIRMDCWFIGNEITVSEGTVGGTPTTLQDLFDYQTLGGTRTGFPLGLIDLDQVFATIRTSLKIGNGSDGLNNEGYLQITSAFLLFNQWSAQVKHNITVTNFSQLDFGEGEVLAGTGNTAAVRGCQIVLPTDREDEISTTLPAASDVTVENGGTLKVFDSKFFRWRDIFLGAAVDTLSTVELNKVIFDSCETVYFRANTLNMAGLIEIYNNSANDRDHCAEMIVSPDSNEDLLVHDCIQGIHFRDTLTLSNYRAQDIDKAGGTNYDLAILEGETVTLVDSFFDPDSILRLAS